eukprot:scaffold13350_cov270-Alexandrium_tamarense.AAC.8
MNTEKKIGHITSFFELQAQDIDENVVKFDQFKGQVTVVANVASYCDGGYIMRGWYFVFLPNSLWINLRLSLPGTYVTSTSIHFNPRSPITQQTQC